MLVAVKFSRPDPLRLDPLRLDHTQISITGALEAANERAARVIDVDELN